MIVNLINENSTQYQLKILFCKTPLENRRRKHGRELIDTTCRIFQGDKEIATGFAKHNSLDKYNKIVGRKVALAKAITNIEVLKYLSVDSLNETSRCTAINLKRRSMRQHIWNVFHRTFGNPQRCSL